MIIQNLPVADSISILQPIVRFHAYAAYRYTLCIKLIYYYLKLIYRLCEESINEFDPALNRKHLEECLKRLLVLYDDRDFLEERYCSQKRSDDDTINLKDFKSLYAVNRANFEAMYVLLNLGEFSAITRALMLPKVWK